MSKLETGYAFDGQQKSDRLRSALSPPPWNGLDLHKLGLEDLKRLARRTVEYWVAAAVPTARERFNVFLSTPTVEFDLTDRVMLGLTDVGAGDAVIHLNPAALLEALFAHLYAAPRRLEHRWRNGDLIVWDNVALQHGRPAINGVRRRMLQRASVAERSLLEQIPDYFEHR